MTAQTKNKQSKHTRATLVTGLGCVSPAGLGTDRLWDAVLGGKSLLLRDGRSYCLGSIPSSVRAGVLAKWATPNAVQGSETLPPGDDALGASYGLEAISQAMQQAGWDGLTDEDGLIFATTTGQIPVWEKAMIQFLSKGMTREAFASYFKHQPLALTLHQIATALNFHGPRQLVTSACAASTQALAIADWWIRSGKVRRCLVGGVELLCDLTIRGFESFQLLSEEPAKPFDRMRKGINLSEAAAFVCLEAADTKPHGLCRLSGGGLGADAFHMTSPEPSGRGCLQAMQRALKAADLEPCDIDWLYAHGTGSSHNDAAESMAMHTLFGAETLVSSTKAIHGHSLAVSGVLESILAVMAIQRSTVLPTFNFTEAGDDVRVNVVGSPTHMTLKHVLKNTLGFGGSNGCVIFSASSEVH